MPRSDAERVADALQSARLAVDFVAAMSLGDLTADPRTLADLKYELLVLGEALGSVSEKTCLGAAQLPWSQVRGLRNVITHEYFRVSPAILYQVVTADLPELIPALEALLNDLELKTDD